MNGRYDQVILGSGSTAGPAALRAAEMGKTAVTCDCPAEAGSASCDLSEEQKDGLCPACGERGKTVDALTVKALLGVSLMEVRSDVWFFCRTAGCPTVYFAGDGKQRFNEPDLRERVHQKHPEDDDVFVCYCFKHTPGSVKAELSRTGRTSVIETITEGIQAGKCACDIRNPQGSCCLGNVRGMADRLVARLGHPSKEPEIGEPRRRRSAQGG